MSSAGACRPAQPGPSGFRELSWASVPACLLARPGASSSLFLIKCQGGVRQSLASSCSKPPGLEDKSLSQGFLQQ